jgi:hypothetical protein
MGDRVLNFSEFADKYSVDGESTLGVDDMSNAADEFTDGFDDSSYDGPEIKANRPVSSEDGITPPGPGEDEAPSFSSDADSGMEAPGEEEEVIVDGEADSMEIPGEEELPTDIAPVEGEEGEAVAPEAAAPSAPPVDADEDGGDPEEDDEDEEDDEEEDEDEETNESVAGLLESFDTFTQEQPPIGIKVGGAELDTPMDGQDHEGHGHEEEEEDDECFVLCKHCGEKKSIPNGQYPFGSANQMDNTSWWKGKEGMSCGCNH